MTQPEAIATAQKALDDAAKHAAEADQVQIGQPSDPSGQDDEQRLANAKIAALRDAAQGRVQDAVQILAGAFPSITWPLASATGMQPPMPPSAAAPGAQPIPPAMPTP